jgi:hypothetical protein
MTIPEASQEPCASLGPDVLQLRRIDAHEVALPPQSLVPLFPRFIWRGNDFGEFFDAGDVSRHPSVAFICVIRSLHGFAGSQRRARCCEKQYEYHYQRDAKETIHVEDP